MKFVKLSLATVGAIAFASSAMADVSDNIKNVKVDGFVKAWYQTSDLGMKDDDFFGKSSSIANASAAVGVTADLGDYVSTGVKAYMLDTLGLENDVVSNVASGRAYTVDATGKRVQDVAKSIDSQSWLGEAYIIAKATPKTIVKVGRQELDTPLAFTESWNATPNTFDAAVLLNSDIPYTTLVLAYVGKGNGNSDGFSVVNNGGKFANYGAANTGVSKAFGAGATGGNDGAYAAAAVVNLKEVAPVTASLWYYNVVDAARAVWLDATYDAKVAKFEAQYADMNPADNVDALAGASIDSTSAFALKASGKYQNFGAFLAYSDVSEDGVLHIQNTATGDKTKLFTASIVSDGAVAGKPGVSSVMLGGDATFAGYKTALTYGMYSDDNVANGDVNEANLIVTKSFGQLGLFLAYVNVDKDSQKDTDDYLRFIATYKF